MAQAQEEPRQQSTKRVVLRNVLFLVGAQILGMPLSLAVNAVMGWKLGPAEFGLLYLAQTFVAFGFLAVEWGQYSVLPALVARERARAREFLGSALAWRAAVVPVVYGALALICFVQGFGAETQVALALVLLVSAIDKAAAAYQDTDMGFERTQMVAFRQVGGQIGVALLVLPTLLWLEGKLREVLLAQALSGAIMLVLVVRTVGPRVGALAVRVDTIKRMLVEGYGFLFLGLAMTLQPYVDAVLLSKLAPGDAVGWYAAARRLVGVLVFPANAVATALFPTLSRLHAEDPAEFRATTSTALRLITILAVPVAVACAAYPDVAISIYGRKAYAPSADDLRVLSLFLLLVYFTMTLGISLLAAGRQRIWAAIQLLCVAVSAGLDPFLVPWFRDRNGNGGLGVCWASVASEVVMLIAGIWLSPAGTFDRKLRRELLLALLAGAVMVGVTRALSGLSPFLAGPLALIAYAACLFATGGISKHEIQAFRTMLRLKGGG